MSLFLLPILCAFYFLVVGIFVLKNNSKNHLARIFFALCFSTFCWHYIFSFAFGSIDIGSAYFLFKVSWCFILFLPTTIYHFFVILLNKKEETKYVYISYVYCGVLLLVHIFTNLVISGVYEYNWGFYPRSGELEILHILQTFIVVSRGLYLGYKALRSSESYKNKLQIKYCIIGFFVYLFAAIDYSTNYGVAILPLTPGFVFVTISLTIISYAIVRHELLDIGVLFSVVLSKVIIYLIFFFIFLLGHVVLTGEYLPNNLGYFASMAFMVVFFCELYLVLFRKIRKVSDSIFTQIKKKDLINKELIVSLEEIYSVDEIATKLKEYFSKKLNIEIDSFYISQDLSSLDQRAYVDLFSNKKNKTILSISKNIHSKILKKESYLLGSEFKGLELKSSSNQILVPFMFAKKLFGFCIVSSGNDLEMWHYDLFNSLIREVGMILDRIRIYQDFLAKKQEHIKEEERSKIYKTLAGSIAHEVRNPLNTINVISNQINDTLRNLDNEIMEIINSNNKNPK